MSDSYILAASLLYFVPISLVIAATSVAAFGRDLLGGQRAEIRAQQAAELPHEIPVRWSAPAYRPANLARNLTFYSVGVRLKTTPAPIPEDGVPPDSVVL